MTTEKELIDSCREHALSIRQDGQSDQFAADLLAQAATALSAKDAEIQSLKNDYSGMCAVVRDKDAEIQRLGEALDFLRAKNNWLIAAIRSANNNAYIPGSGLG